MTREEEIKQASELAYPYSNGIFTDGMRDCFINGAEWADQHQRKGLWDSDRVIAWLKEHIGEYYMTNEFEEYFDSMYEDLRKAMED